MIVKTNFNRENLCIDVRRAVWVAEELVFSVARLARSL